MIWRLTKYQRVQGIPQHDSACLSWRRGTQLQWTQHQKQCLLFCVTSLVWHLHHSRTRCPMASHIIPTIPPGNNWGKIRRDSKGAPRDCVISPSSCIDSILQHNTHWLPRYLWYTVSSNQCLKWPNGLPKMIQTCIQMSNPTKAVACVKKLLSGQATPSTEPASLHHETQQCSVYMWSHMYLLLNYKYCV